MGKNKLKKQQTEEDRYTEWRHKRSMVIDGKKWQNENKNIQ